MNSELQSACIAPVAGPVHLVQCENWLTYSYWNEKNRRMEIAVIELYEGSEQTDELRFNSLTPTLPPVVAGPVHLVQCENWLTYSYWNEKNRRMEIAVIELYEGSEQTDELRFNSLTPTLPPVVHAISRAYIFPQGISALGVTETEQGLSTRSLLVAMPFGGIYGISKRIIDARRPLEMTPELAEEMLIPYRPELPIAPEDFVNYNQTVYNIRSIKASPSGLESTSLMLAYGLDLFFARLTPSGTFDILKDDFDHLLISIVLVGLVVACLICKKLGRNHSLKQAWQ
uniref:ER membrane protein complex subunit 1 n=1 Tax=Ascaris lumbricoides TaxID=6252 RepID=A0A9J2Q256_ASCLU